MYVINIIQLHVNMYHKTKQSELNTQVTSTKVKYFTYEIHSHDRQSDDLNYQHYLTGYRCRRCSTFG